MNINKLTPAEKQELANSCSGKADWAKEDYDYNACIEYCGKSIELDSEAELAYKLRGQYIYERGYENNCAEDFEIALSDNLNLVRIYQSRQIADPNFYDNYQGELRKESAVMDVAWCYLQLGRFQETYDTACGVLERQKLENNWKTSLHNILQFSKEKSAQNGVTLRLNAAIEAEIEL